MLSLKQSESAVKKLEGLDLVLTWEGTKIWDLFVTFKVVT